jgi:hypothetical protein
MQHHGRPERAESRNDASVKNTAADDTVAASHGVTAEIVPAEIDFSHARHGNLLPRDPVARAHRLEARVIALQRAGAQLRDKLDRVLVLLAWEAGQLSEAEAATRLGVAPRTLDKYRAAALAEVPPGDVGHR